MNNTDIVTAASEESGRTAVVHEEIDSVWLYLSRPGEARPDVACWVLNTLDAPRVRTSLHTAASRHRRRSPAHR